MDEPQRGWEVPSMLETRADQWDYVKVPSRYSLAAMTAAANEAPLPIGANQLMQV
jgi:hypothetical protein